MSSAAGGGALSAAASVPLVDVSRAADHVFRLLLPSGLVRGEGRRRRAGSLSGKREPGAVIVTDGLPEIFISDAERVLVKFYPSTS